jgi:hypothetical protein
LRIAESVESGNYTDERQAKADEVKKVRARVAAEREEAVAG